MSDEKKFKVPFHGFAYVYASDEEEAIEKCDDDDYVYAEKHYGDVEEVDDFVVTM